MALATLRKLKTETRRLTGLDLINENPDGYLFTGLVDRKGVLWAAFGDTSIGDLGPPTWVKFPYGNLLDHLWLRENWRVENKLDLVKPRDLDPAVRIFYEADAPPTPHKAGKLRPSIHMPRWASRGLVQILTVGVQRLHDISEASAKAEGAPRGLFTEDETRWITFDFNLESPLPHPGKYREGFKYLWITINGRLSWNDNPWVWVIGYRLETIGRPAASNN
jgi:hypothetical protein